jgi:serine/threonine-protein kinase
LSDPDLRARFATEAQITGPITSEHLVHISDAGIDAATDMPFLVMELLAGEDLAALLRERSPLSTEEALLYLSQVARALDKTHAAGIVHRDLKPENLFLTQHDDGSPCIKLLDFGIAKLVVPSKDAQATRALGTPFYMSPEQIGGDGAIGPRADLYSLGQLAYTLLVGEPYWYEESLGGGKTLALVVEIVLGARERPSDRALRRAGVLLPPTFDAWFLTITATKPEARFEHATTAFTALAEALGVRTEAAPSLRWAPVRDNAAAMPPVPTPSMQAWPAQGPPPVPAAPMQAWPAQAPAAPMQAWPAQTTAPTTPDPARTALVVVVCVIGALVVLGVLGLIGLGVLGAIVGPPRPRSTPGRR